jgi:hypothetical protein
MPGVMRPYTIADVLGTMNLQDTLSDQDIVNGVGAFSEADETIAAADGAFITAGTPAGWDAGQWGATLWQ